MTMDTAMLSAMGSALYEAERLRKPLAPLSQSVDGSLDEAYAIQEEYARLRLGQGTTLVGRKIGATSKAIQEQLGVPTPDFGHIFADMVVLNGGSVSTDELIAPMVEPEIAFVLGSDLKGPAVTREDVLEAVSHVVPCLEIIDSRIVDWRIKFFDTVADNGSSARCILGSSPLPLDGRDLREEVVRLFVDGQQVAEGCGDAVLGHPAESVAWLVNMLAQVDRGLRAGEFVLSGSLTRACKAARGSRYEARFSSIGNVSCHFV